MVSDDVREVQDEIDDLDELEESPEAVEEPEELVSEGYDLVMGGAETQRLVIADYFKGADPDSFIEAKGTGLKEDQVIEAGTQISIGGGAGGNRAARRANKRGGDRVTAIPRPNHAFMAKCRAQITDFCLQAKDPKTDEIVARRFGKPAENDAIYVLFLRPGNERMKDLVEGFLDKMAGRDTPTQEDFEALGNVR